MSAKIFYIGDTHFGHSNILKFSRNEFIDSDKSREQCVEDMNNALVDAWNSRVNKKDVVWHLGDVAFGANNLQYLSQCNGIKYLVMGNHDTYNIKFYQQYFSKIRGMCFCKDRVMSHMPVHPRQIGYRVKYNIHGHIHAKEQRINDSRYLCANVDTLPTYAPVTFEELLEYNQ